MPFCNRCGKEIESIMQFCPYCGSRIKTQGRIDAIRGPNTATPPPHYQSPAAPTGLHHTVIPAYSPAKKKIKSRPVIGILGTASMAVAIACSFLPWVSWPGFSKTGWSGDGKITFFMGIATVIFFILAAVTKARWPYIIGFPASLLTAAVFVINIVDTIDKAGLNSISYGLYLGMAAACLTVLFSIFGLTVVKEEVNSGNQGNLPLS